MEEEDAEDVEFTMMLTSVAEKSPGSSTGKDPKKPVQLEVVEKNISTNPNSGHWSNHVQAYDTLFICFQTVGNLTRGPTATKAAVRVTAPAPKVASASAAACAPHGSSVSKIIKPTVTVLC